MTAEPTRLDGYIRVSRRAGREGDSYISPSVQRDAIERWADYKSITIAEWHVDEDWSGGTHQRPGLERAIERAIAGETGGIVSWKLDRFSRQTEGGLRDVRRLEAADARLAFVVEDIDTRTTYGKMVYTILLAVSEAFLENIKAGWAVTKSRAVARGAYVSRTPWGYQRNPDGTLSPHPDRAAIVSEAFRIAARDSLRAATDYLERVAPQRRWNATKTRRLISQRSYLGDTYNGDFAQAGTHEPLVSRAIWEAAQTAPAERGPRQAFPLSGLLRCGTCGGPMVGSRGGKGQRTYRCAATLTTAIVEKCERGANVTASIAESYLHDVARELLSKLRVTVGDPEADTLTLLERTVSDAEAELDAFAADMAMRRALGARYHEHLQARVDAVESARSAYREQARRQQARLALSADDLLDRPERFAAGLRGMFASIIVQPGRGIAIADRLTLVPIDGDSSTGKLATERT